MDEVKFVVESLVVKADDASNKIGVTTDVLSYGVSDNISTEENRVLVDGGHEGVINNAEDANLFANLSDSLNIEDLKGWVGGSLEPDDFGVGSDERLELSCITEVLEGNFNVSVGSENSS